MSSVPPNIGIVSVDGIPPYGGMGRYVQILYEGLQERGFKAFLFDRSMRPLSMRLARNIGFSFGVTRALRAWVEQHGIELLHIHTGPGGVLLSNALPLPTIVTAHHTYASQSDLPRQYCKRLLIPWERKTLSLASALIAVSDDTKATLVSRYDIPAEQISIISPGVPLPLWSFEDRDALDRVQNSIVFVGRRGSRKGLDILLAAFLRVQNAIPHASLSIVGIEGASKAGISYLGRLSDLELRRIIGSCRCVVCPSRLEGFGMVALEAMAAGTPVVAQNVLGLRGVVDHESTGLLTSPGNTVALGDALIRMLQDTSLWERCHSGAKTKRASYDAPGVIDAHIRLYDRVYSAS